MLCRARHPRSEDAGLARSLGNARAPEREPQEEEARAQQAAAQEQFEHELPQLRWEVKKLKLEHELWLFEQKYSPNQPRDELGRWTSGANSVGDAAAAGTEDESGSGAILSDATPGPLWPGAQYAEATSGRYSVNLDEEEAPRGIGHTLREHVGKSDAELMRKLDEDWQRFRTGRFEITEYRPAQESSCLRESSNDFVNRTLEENKETVDRVASGAQDRATLEKRLGYVTGKEPFRANGDAEPYVRSTYGIRMVIRDDLRSENGYRVYTAFPVNEYVTKR